MQYIIYSLHIRADMKKLEIIQHRAASFLLTNFQDLLAVE